MKLTYWHAAYTYEDHKHYDIRTKTRKEAVRQIEERGHEPDAFGEIEKVVVEYDDGFDLMWKCLTGQVLERDW